MPVKIVIDAGHGGYDPGATYQGRNEKDDTLNLALAVGEILRQDGYDVVFTRTEDVYDSPSQKARIANESGADFFVSIHRNSSPTPNQYNGVQTLVYDNSGIKQTMAENVNNELEKLGFRNINVPARPNLTVLRRTNMPAILVEAGFINSDVDNQLFDSKFNEIAEAIARGISKTIQDANIQAMAPQNPVRTMYVNAMANMISNDRDVNGAVDVNDDLSMPDDRNENLSAPNDIPDAPSDPNIVMVGDDNPDPDNMDSNNPNNVGNGIADDRIDTPANGNNNMTYYQVLVGVYDNFGAARYQLNRLINEGYYAEIYEQGARYQLRVGRYEDIEEAISAQRQLRDAGYNTLIVRGDI